MSWFIVHIVPTRDIMLTDGLGATTRKDMKYGIGNKYSVNFVGQLPIVTSMHHRSKAMNHLDASQINFGLLVKQRRQPQAYLADDFAEPFNEAVEWMQKNPEWCKEDLVKVIAPSFIQDSEHAVAALNGMGDTTDWAKIMHDYAEDMRLGDALERAGRNLKRGKPADYLTLSGHIQARVLKDAHGPTTLNEIDCTDYKPFMPSGDDGMDGILGGWPTDGPIIVYGLTGTGKSHWLASRMAKFLLHHKEKRGIIYTLEMGAKHWKWRETKMYPYIEDVGDRYLVSSDVRGIDELVAEVSAGQYDIVGIDDMDGIVRENSAAEYERVYSKIKEICRFLKIPVIAIGQPNRNAKLANKFLGRYDVAWSGAAENSAALLVALQVANELDLEEGQPFPAFDEDHEYEIIWKSRDGWPGDYGKGQFGPGAIIRKMISGKKWEGKPIGKSEASAGTLWRPYSRTVIKKKSKKKYDND